MRTIQEIFCTKKCVFGMGVRACCWELHKRFIKMKKTSTWIYYMFCRLFNVFFWLFSLSFRHNSNFAIFEIEGYVLSIERRVFWKWKRVLIHFFVHLQRNHCYFLLYFSWKATKTCHILKIFFNNFIAL